MPNPFVILATDSVAGFKDEKDGGHAHEHGQGC